MQVTVPITPLTGSPTELSIVGSLFSGVPCIALDRQYTFKSSRRTEYKHAPVGNVKITAILGFPSTCLSRREQSY